MSGQFMPPNIEWAGLAPIIIVLGAGVLGVLIEAFAPAGRRRAIQTGLALAATAGAAVAVALLWSRVRDEAILSVGDSFDLTPFGLAIQGIVAVFAFLAFLVMADRPGGQDAFAPLAASVPGSALEEQARLAGLQQTEVFPLALFSTGGMMLLTATDDLIVLFVALEVLSLPLYVLCATARRRRLLSQEAAFKYFVLGAFASALTVFGIALLYGFAGSVHLPDIADALAGRGDSPLAGLQALAVTGIVLLCAGLLFKVGAAPFHTWVPDVYTGAPTPATGFMAACTKAAAVGALVRVLFYLGESFDAHTRREVQVLLWTVAIATMLIGTVVAVQQTNIKRMLAYSSISHAGFILVALVGFSDEGVKAVLVYLVGYGLATIGAFACITLVRERACASAPSAGGGGSADRGESGGFLGDAALSRPSPAEPVSAASAGSGIDMGEATEIAQWAGLGRKSPWLAAAFSLFMLSMAGIPLTAGFIGKFQAFGAAVGAGAWPLALVGVLASAVSALFYMRLIATMLMPPPAPVAADAAVEPPAAEDSSDPSPTADAIAPDDAGLAAESSASAISGASGSEAATKPSAAVVVGWTPTAVVVAACAAGVLLLGLLPNWLLTLAAGAARLLP